MKEVRLEFDDLNSATKHFANELLKSSSVLSTNDANSDKYKNELGGELIQQFFVLKSPQAVIGTFENHKPHKWWTYGEILSEMLNLDPPIMYKYKPELFDKHYDLLEDGRMQYTYSSRFTEFNQFVNIFKKLKENPNSKRCVIDIFTPYDTAPDRKDTPCTTMYHLIHRDGKLNMSVFYRSWDFFGGFKTYDFALSSFIQQSFCSWLGMELGNLGFYVNSLHYYNRDRQNLENLVNEMNVSDKRSDLLALNEKTNMREFYNQLREIKHVEDAAYHHNFEDAEKSKNKISIALFKDMAETWINKNKQQLQSSSNYEGSNRPAGYD